MPTITPRRTTGRRPHRVRRRIAAAAAGLALHALGAQAVQPIGEPLEVGIIPTLSTRTIFNTYRPLREYLARSLGRPVLLVTAPDFRTLVERTQRGEYRYLITASHFARLAQKQAGYVPLVRVQRDLGAMIVVSASSGIHTLQQLRGTTVATPDRLAIISILGRDVLRQSGLKLGEDVIIRAYPSFNSAVLAVANGGCAAAVTAQSALNQMPAKIRAGLNTLAGSKAVPHVVLLANSQVPGAERERMKALLLAFNDDPEGSLFLQRTGFQAYVEVKSGELVTLDPYLDEISAELDKQ